MDLGVSIFDFVFCFRVQRCHHPRGIHRWVGSELDCSFNMLFFYLPTIKRASTLGVGTWEQALLWG